jgi:tetratricopeptide (TPR) repeat protein
MLEFFPGGDTSQQLQVSAPGDRRWILNTVGFCLVSLGRLGKAAPFFERFVSGNIAAEDWRNASRGYINLAELHAHLGAPAASAAAREALALARRAENKRDERNSLAHQAWAAHLRGPSAGSGQALQEAGAAFGQAEALEREIDPEVRYLCSQRGIRHAGHLRRAGDPSAGSGQAAAYARRITEANLEICQRNHWPDTLSRSHRVLGDLDAGDGQHESARAHYDQALKLARGISRRDVLVEALLARGRWAAKATLAKVSEPSQGLDPFSDLNEALGYALDVGYRIYEADIRIALAWAHRAEALTLPPPGPRGETGAGSPTRRGTLEAARAEAERARQLSVEMGYHWGQVDAAEVLSALEQGQGTS